MILDESQREFLEECRGLLNDPEIKARYNESLEHASRYREILEQRGFPEKDLTDSDLDELFQVMRKVVKNRALARNLYEKNGLQTFNSALRELLFGESILAKRIHQFINLRGVRRTTASHFLLLFAPSEFPIVTKQSKSVLNLQPLQKTEFEELAIDEYGITDTNEYNRLSIQLMRDFIIYSEVMDILGAPDYLMLNRVLWKKYVDQEDQTEEELTSLGAFTTVSLESDLRSYLVRNPERLREGLTVVQEEYDTRQIGRMDILLKDDNNNYIVVETKKKHASDRVVGQILRYVGWVSQNVSENVGGIIVMSEPDDRVESALVTTPHIEVMYYRIRFDFSQEPFID